MAKKLDGAWRRIFLRTLARTGNAKLAAEQAGVDKGTAYDLRNRDARFAADWARAGAWGKARIAAGAVDPEEAAGPLVVRVSKNNGAQLVKAAKGRWSGESESVFLSHLGATGATRRAAEACGFSTTALYRRRKRDPHFAEKWRVEKERGCRRVSLMLLDAAEAALDPERDAAAEGILPVSVAEAIAILRVHKFEGGEAPGPGRGRRGMIVKEEPPIEAVRDEVLRRLAAMRRQKEREGGGDGGDGGDGVVDRRRRAPSTMLRMVPLPVPGRIR